MYQELFVTLKAFGPSTPYENVREALSNKCIICMQPQEVRDKHKPKEHALLRKAFVGAGKNTFLVAGSAPVASFCC